MLQTPSGSERWLTVRPLGRTTSRSPSVFVVGDSIMVASERLVGKALSRWRVTFDAVVGRSTGGGLAAIQSRPSRLGDAAVIELGTNDKTSRRFTRAGRRLLDRIARTPLIVWVTVRGPHPPVPLVNGAIAALAARLPNVAVADWNRVVSPGGLRSDGIHPNHAGKLAMAHLLEPFLDSWLAATDRKGPRSCEREALALARRALA